MYKMWQDSRLITMKKDRGFTFVEILVSLVIIVVLAVMTKSIINYYGGMQNEILAKRANLQLVGFLEPRGGIKDKPCPPCNNNCNQGRNCPNDQRRTN